ncbi:ribonuclease Z [Bacillus cereus]|nr:ribonuclease Z [Bacillus cereus]
MLNFYGVGSAFNTKLGNNGAFLKTENMLNFDTLFLIDCGSATYSRLEEKGLLHQLRHFKVLMTHTHPDHIGSLGDLVYHSYYDVTPLMEPKLTIYAPSDLMNSVQQALLSVGVTSDLYMTHKLDVEEDNQIEAIAGLTSIKPHRVIHAPELICYGYTLTIHDKVVYYSGDSNMIPENVRYDFIGGHIDYFYQDTCTKDYEGNVHLSLAKLTELIPEELRHKVYCMHLDKKFPRTKASQLGFNIVESI